MTMTVWRTNVMLLCGTGVLAVGGPSRLIAQAPGSSASEPITAVIDVTRTGEPIDPLLYGYFIENLGTYFESGLWAELLSDRKFFYPIDDNPTLDPPNSRSSFVNRWWPVGPSDGVVMDSTRVYVGEHSPRVLLAGAARRGIRQDLGIRGGRGYAGRIVLAGGPSVTVEVSLVWGPDADERETVAISDLSEEFRKFPLRFDPEGGSPDGRIEITGTGDGSFLIGAVSLMPDDNVEGWDREVLELVRSTNPTTFRWGGNFSSGYDWRDGIGDPDRRPPRYDYAWGALEPNDVGTFEVLALNRLLDTEPYVGVNAGLGDAHSAAEWVEYVNGSVDTPMGALRAEHGHPEPFGVRWWGVGNEMYGEWQLGHMAIDDYVIKQNRFAEAMREVDPSIILVASGASLFQMQADSRDQRRPDLPPYAYDSPWDWSGNLLRHSWQYMDHLSEHIYHPIDAYFDVTTQTWVEDDNAPVEDRARRLANRVEGAAEAWEEYRRRMPWLAGTGIRIVFGEWSGGDAEAFRLVSTPMILNELFRHTDVFFMSHPSSNRQRLDHDRYHQPVLRAPGLVFRLYTSRFGTLPILDIGGNAPQPKIEGTVGVDLPEVSSGSPTWPLDVMAALSEDGRRLSVAVVNPSETTQQLRLEVRGVQLPESGTIWTISAPDLQAENLAGRPPMIETVESALTDPTGVRAVDPLSANMYVFEIR